MKTRKGETAQPASGIEHISHSVEETRAFGERLGHLLQPGDVLALSGELGSGKTTLIQGMAQGLGLDSALIKSPTFVLMREYQGPIPVVHIDGYRLEGASAVSWLDVDLMFSPQKITLIEWAERFEGLLPEWHLDIHLSHVSTHRRRIIVVLQEGARAAQMVAELRQLATRNPQPATPLPDSSDVAGN